MKKDKQKKLAQQEAPQKRKIEADNKPKPVSKMGEWQAVTSTK